MPRVKEAPSCPPEQVCYSPSSQSNHDCAFCRKIHFRTTSLLRFLVQDNVSVRKLTTILSADAAEYSRLMRQDEQSTASMLRCCRAAIDERVATHRGRIFGTAGDSVIAEFASPVEALECAVDIQQAVQNIAAELPSERQMLFRIGINLGDVLVEGNDLIGDGVNIADRVRALGDPGQICISSSVYEVVGTRAGFAYDDLGKVSVKNIAEPIHAYRLRMVAGAPSKNRSRRRRNKYAASIALGVILLVAAAAGVKFGYPILAHRFVREPGPSGEIRASIAVLPFDNLSGDSAQDYFVDGLTDDVISALGKFSNLSVMSREATEEYKGKAVSPGELSAKFGVRYTLHGTVRRSGDRIRVTADLADATTGKQLWSDSYDGEVKDVFAVQDDITQNVVGALAVKLSDIERRRSLAKPPENLQAYDYLQRGLDYFHRNTLADNLAARKMLETALGLDPNYAAAHVALGYVRVTAAFSGWTENVVESVEAAKSHGERALEIDNANAEAHALLGSVYLNLGENDKALVEIRKAIELNPNDADSYAGLGGIFTYRGDAEEAIRAFEIALRLNPDMGVGRFSPVGWAYYLSGRYEDAIRVQQVALRHSPEDYFVHACIAASYAQLGLKEDAAKAAQNTLRTWPFFSVEQFAEQFDGERAREAITDGLRKAGLK